MADEQKKDYVAKVSFNAGFGHFVQGDSVSKEQLEQAKVSGDQLLRDGLIVKASDYKDGQDGQGAKEGDKESKDYPPGLARINSGVADPNSDPTPEHAKERNQGYTDKHPPKAEDVEREAKENRSRARPVYGKSGPAPVAPALAGAQSASPAVNNSATPGATSSANQSADNASQAAGRKQV